MMSKMFFCTTLILGCWLLPVSSTQAQSLYFYLYNNTGYTISKVYVSPSEYSSWGYNLIPGKRVYDENQLYVFIPNTYGNTCYFDVKVVASNGKWWKFTNLDMCDLYRLSINWNGTYRTEWD